MIANISPSIIFYEDTFNTLKYAKRAMCVKTQAFAKSLLIKASTVAECNNMRKKVDIKELLGIIENLKKENSKMKS